MLLWQINKFREQVPGFDKFILDLHQWLQDGMPKGKDTPFVDSCGLCANFIRFTGHERGIPAIDVYDVSLGTSFRRILGTSYPFNSGEGDMFNDELRDGTMYSNKTRLGFIKEAWEVISS